MEKENMPKAEKERTQCAEDCKMVDHVPFVELSGFKACEFFLNESNYREIFEMVPKIGDIFLSTYPKSGTTWTQYIMWGIVHDGAVPPDTNKMMFIDFPTLEYTGLGKIDSLPEPRMMKLHLPFRLTPRDQGCKYISVMRNPFDCCVSLYHFLNDGFLKPIGLVLRFETHVQDFVNGNIPFGSYFENVQSWYEKRNEPNVLFFTYEDTKANPKETVLKIAAFLGPERRDKLEENEEILQDILKHSSFEYMKANYTYRVPRDMAAICELGKDFYNLGLNSEKLYDDRLLTNTDFYRKGTVGSSKAELSAEQWQAIDEAIDENIVYPELKALMRKTKL